MPRSLEYRKYHHGSNKYTPYLRSAWKGVKFAWKHRKSISSAARSTADAIRSFRKSGRSATYKGYGKARVSGTRPLKQSLQGTSQHNDTSTRFFKVTIRKGRKLRGNKISRKKHHFKYGEEWNTILTSNEGYQGIADCKMIGSKDQLNGVVNSSRQLIYTSAASYYELNPFRINTGSAIFPTGTMGTPMTNDKLYYRSVNGVLKIVNLESLATYVTILWCKCKKNTNSSPAGAWTNGATNERMGSLIPGYPTVTTGVGSTAAAGYTRELHIGNMPQMYQSFRDYWQVIHREKTYLQGGDQIDFKFHFNINKLINRQTENESGGLYVANMSIVPLVIQYGALAGISDLIGATASTEVVHGITKTGIAIIQNHEFGPVPAETRTPTGQFFPGMVHGVGDIPAGHIVQEKQIDDTDEPDGIKRV